MPIHLQKKKKVILFNEVRETMDFVTLLIFLSTKNFHELFSQQQYNSSDVAKLKH